MQGFRYRSFRKALVSFQRREGYSLLPGKSGRKKFNLDSQGRHNFGTNMTTKLKIGKFCVLTTLYQTRMGRKSDQAIA